jgi:hypothetical protein
MGSGWEVKISQNATTGSTATATGTIVSRVRTRTTTTNDQECRQTGNIHSNRAVTSERVNRGITVSSSCHSPGNSRDTGKVLYRTAHTP